MLDIDIIEIVGSCLLFCLVFAMSATVDIACMMAQLKNKRAILTGVFLQFIVLPFLGFVVVKALNMNAAMGITLLVVTSSPGGSYSNWWCSMFNADLALSVSMTAISTLLSTFMLPINLLLYAKLTYDASVTSNLDWIALFFSLVIVLSAIGLGLYVSEKFNSHNFNLHANRLGNLAGISLIIFSAVMSNSGEDSKLWERPWRFYVGVAAPCVFGLLIANLMTTGIELLKPERVTVSIECCYQNVGIATSVALTMFQGDERAEALGVPLYYGLVEAVILGIYCIGAWKAGWTKAPKNISFWKAIGTSYEIVTAEKAEIGELPIKDYDDDDNDHRTDIDDDTEAGFHYVQHTDAEDSAAAKLEGMKKKKKRRWKRVTEMPSLRRSNREKEKKEPSFVQVVALEEIENDNNNNNNNTTCGVNTDNLCATESLCVSKNAILEEEEEDKKMPPSEK